MSDIADGHSKGFDPLRGGSSAFGYRNACPHHHGARMAWNKDEFLKGDRSHSMCGAHGALFRIEDGLCVAGPRLGQSLDPVRVGIRGDEVWLCDACPPAQRR